MEEYLMKQIGKKMTSLFLLAIIIVASMGCDGGSNNVNKTSYTQEEAQNIEVLKIGDEIISLDEIYLYTLQYLYTYKIDQKTAGQSVEEHKARIISQLRQEEIKYQVAKSKDIELTEKELEELKRITDNYYKTFGEEFFERYGISQETIENLFIKQKFITELQNRSVLELQDVYKKDAEKKYEDINFYEMYYILFPTVEFDNQDLSKKDENNQYISISKEEKEKQLELAKEAHAKALAGTDMEQLAKEYKVEQYSGSQMGYQDAFSEKLNQLTADMKTGDISDVYEDELGYMVVKMINDNDNEYKNYFMEAYAQTKANDEAVNLEQFWLSQIEIDERGDMIGDVWEKFNIEPIAKYLEERKF